MQVSDTSSNQPLVGKLNPAVRKIWWVVFVTGIIFGLTNGLYLYTWGPYFYTKFGGITNPATAMILTSSMQLAFSGVSTLLEIPTGAIADAVGRAHVVMLSWSFRMAFFVCLAIMWLSHSVMISFTIGMLGAVLFTIGYTFFNGAFAAWGVDWLREKAPDMNYAWISSRFYSYRSGAEIFGAMIAIWCYVKGFPYLSFCLGGVVSFLGMAYAMIRMEEVQTLHFLSLKQVQWSTITKRIGELIGRGTQICFKKPAIFWIIFTYGSYMYLLNIVKYLWPVHLESTWGSSNVSWKWIGLVVFSLVLTTLSSRWLAWLTQRWVRSGGTPKHMVALRRIFVAAGLLSSLPILVLSYMTAIGNNSFLIFAGAITFVTFNFGIIAPCFETLVNNFIPPSESQQRATIISAGSMVRGILLGLLAIPAGGTSGEKSPIFWAIPAGLLLFSILLANHFMRRSEKAVGVAMAEAMAANKALPAQ